jgi:hypothetical protein
MFLQAEVCCTCGEVPTGRGVPERRFFLAEVDLRKEIPPGSGVPAV